jgi:hypothetical protein
MSARDDGIDKGEGFLGRWIKRKAQARDVPESEAPAQSDKALADKAVKGSPAAEQGSRATADEPVFDLSSLPSLDDIGAQTNIADFMRKEVPAALRNAALRRAWAADPAIRDYVNPAREYAFDWNTPGGVPGNGPLEEGYDALKQVAESFQSRSPDHPLEVSEGTVGKADAPPMSENELSSVRISDAPAPEAPPQIAENKEASEEAETPAPQQEVSMPDINRSRRRHGGAAPA